MNQPSDKWLKAIQEALPYPARETRSCLGLTLVLLDPDQYLPDTDYTEKRSAGMPALRNLWAFDSRGLKTWEADLPEPVDYYYEIVSISPLTVRSFSGYTCELDPSDGRIVRKTFGK